MSNRKIAYKWSLAVVAFLFMQTSGLAAESGPRIRFDALSYDFGEIYQEEEVTYEFSFRNVGDATLNIIKVSASCGCAAALPAQKEIAPGRVSKIKVTFKSGQMRDRVTKHVYVESNDRVEPRVSLTIMGTVKLEVETIPSGIYLSNVKVGEIVERTVVIKPVTVKKFRIFEVTANDELLKVEKPTPIPDKPGSYELKIKYGPVEKPTRIHVKVKVKTDLPHTKELTISVYGSIGMTDIFSQKRRPVAPVQPAN